MKNLKIFKNSRVIVTGHTGFKGSWLTAWLKQLGANVMGISLAPPPYPSHFEVSKINLGIKDIRLDISYRKKLENLAQKNAIITSFKTTTFRSDAGTNNSARAAAVAAAAPISPKKHWSKKAIILPFKP